MHKKKFSFCLHAVSNYQHNCMHEHFFIMGVLHVKIIICRKMDFLKFYGFETNTVCMCHVY